MPEKTYFCHKYAQHFGTEFPIWPLPEVFAVLSDATFHRNLTIYVPQEFFILDRHKVMLPRRPNHPFLPLTSSDFLVGNSECHNRQQIGWMGVRFLPNDTSVPCLHARRASRQNTILTCLKQNAKGVNQWLVIRFSHFFFSRGRRHWNFQMVPWAWVTLSLAFPLRPRQMQ